MHQLLSAGGGPFEDVFRLFHPGRAEAYTCWSTATGARVNNYGSRIDLILAGQPQQRQHGQQSGQQQHGQPGQEQHGWQYDQKQQQQHRQQEHGWQLQQLEDSDEGQGAFERQEGVEEGFLGIEEEGDDQQQQGIWVLHGTGEEQQRQHKPQHKQKDKQQQDQQQHLLSSSVSQKLQESPLGAVPSAPTPTAEGAGHSCSSSTALLSWFTDCQILPEVQGSDHAPVVAELEVPVQLLRQGGEPPPLATKFMFSGRQTSLRDFLGKFNSNGSSSSGAANGGGSRDSSQVAAAAAGGGGGGYVPAGLAGEAVGWVRKGGASSSGEADVVSQNGVPSGPLAGGGVHSCRGPNGVLVGGGRVEVAAAGGGAPRQMHRKSSGSRKGGSQNSLWGFVRPQAGATAAAAPTAAAARGGNSAGLQAAGATVPGGKSGNNLWKRNSSWRNEALGVQGMNIATAAIAGAAVAGAPSEPVVLCGGAAGEQQEGEEEERQQQQEGEERQQQPAGGSQAVQMLWNGQSSLLEQQQGHWVQEQQQQGHALGQQQQQQQQQVSAAADDGGGMLLHEASQQHQSAVQAWQRISNMMAPPKCKGHQEPCVVRTVKKKGENNGRQFYVCARPDGPPPVGRCDFFLWASQRAVKGSNQPLGGSGGKAGVSGKGQARKSRASSGEQKRPRLEGAQR